MTITPLRPDAASTADPHRVEELLALAKDIADANKADCRAGLPVTIEAEDLETAANLLPKLPAAEVQAVLLDVVDWVFESRGTDDTGRDPSDSEIEAFLESGRGAARTAIVADTLAAGAA